MRAPYPRTYPEPRAIPTLSALPYLPAPGQQQYSTTTSSPFYLVEALRSTHASSMISLSLNLKSETALTRGRGVPGRPEPLAHTYIYGGLGHFLRQCAPSASRAIDQSGSKTAALRFLAWDQAYAHGGGGHPNSAGRSQFPVVQSSTHAAGFRASGEPQ